MLNNISTENFFFSNSDSSIYDADKNNKLLYLEKFTITFLKFGSNTSTNL